MAAEPTLSRIRPAALRVLLVEDDANDAELMRAYLAEAAAADAELLHVRSLGEGLRLLQSQEVHLTLLDLDLPDSTGFHTLERMRAVAAGPVIVVSGNGHPSLVEEVLKRRAYDVIPKHELDAAMLRRILRLARLHYETGQALRSTEGRFRALIENSNEALVLLDADGRVEYASASMRRVLGFEAAEALGRHGLSFVHSEDRAAVQETFLRLQETPGASHTQRVRFLHKDGSSRLLESSLVNRLGDAEVAAIVCNYRDLTSVAELEAQFRATFEHAAIGLARIDAQGRIELANERLCSILGYTREELVGRTFRDVSHPEDRDASATQRAQLYAGTIAEFTLRKRYLRKDGTTVWVQVTAALVRSANGGPLYEITAFENISEAVRVEAELRQSEQRFRALIENSADGIVLLGADGRIRYGSPATTRILGYEDNETLGLDSKALVHPEDIGAFLHDMADVLRAPGRTIAGRARLRHKDGNYRLLEGTWSNLLHLRGVEALAVNFRDITEQDHSRQALADSEARFRSLTELASDWFWEQDEELRFMSFAGGQGDAKWGGDQSQAIGLRRWEIPGITPLSASWEEHRALLQARRPFRDFEYMRVTESGERRYVTSSGEPIHDAAGTFTGYRGTAADITERKSAEQRIRLEHTVARHLAGAGTAGEGLVAVMRAICESEGWDCGRYFTVDEAAGLLRVTKCWGVADDEVQRFIAASRDMTLRADAGLAGAVWRSGAPLWLEDISTDPRVSEAGRAITGEMRSAFVFPITVQSHAIGVLALSGREIREPDERLLQTMLTIGSQVGQFLQRKLAEESTRASEARFRSLTDLSSDWYWEQDAELRFVATGGSHEARGGITAAQHYGLRRWELPGTEALGGSWEEHKATLAARVPFRDLLLKRTGNDGAVHYVSVSGEPIFGEDGEFLGYRGIAKDVTAGHEAMRALQENERRLSALFSNLPGMAYRCRNDANWTSEFVSEGARALTGYAPEDFVSGRVSFAQVMHPEDRTRAWNTAQEALRNRVPFVLEYRLHAADGGEKRVWERGTGVYAQDGSVLALEGFIEDITERRLAEAALRESEERFRSLTALSSDWYWEQDAEFRFTHTSVDRGSSVYGDPARAQGKARWELPLTPLSCTWEQHRETLEAHRTFRDFEYSYAGEDGKPRYLSASGYPVYDGEGRFTGYRGIAKDISERKRAERHVRMHAERQEAIARFGQFALDRHSAEALYTEAARVIRCEGVDAVCVLEMFTAPGEYLVRATQGEGPHASLGKRGPISPDSVWPEILRENAPRIAGRKYLATRPLDRPWRAWLRDMGSVIYAPVRDDEKPIAMLCLYAAAEHAFGSEDVRFAEAVAHVLSTALQRQKAEQRLAHLAQFDALTGLPNRMLVQDRLTQSLVQSRRRQTHAGVLFVDLDRFKLINDSLGHHQGDALIRQVGERLLACVRPGDTVGRISGDEFAVVLADLARPDDTALVAQKVLDALAKPFDLGGNEAYVTASIGIAAFPGDGDDAETLLKNADTAMYRAKESALNSYCFFTAEMNQHSVAKVQLNTDLRRALERGEFALHYQPKVDLASGKLRGMEALLRWNHPARGMVSPGEFIPSLEDSGLIVAVGEWVVEEACRQVRLWQAAGCMPVPVAVNLSPKQFRRRDLDALVGDALVRAGLSAEFLELEITESCLMENPEDAVRMMRNLRAAGLRISIDDFGTGYSSLSYLTRLPLSALKIDRSFVRDADSSAESASIVRAVIDMAQNLRLTVIAEGVETEQQAGFLRRHGCDQAQGYFYGRPVAAEKIGERLTRA